MQVVHGDLKTSNLLVDSNYEVFITDFGLARMQVRPPPGKILIDSALSAGYQLRVDVASCRRRLLMAVLKLPYLLARLLSSVT